MRTSNNKSPLDQAMVWRQIDLEPLPEPMMTQFDDVYAQAAT